MGESPEQQEYNPAEIETKKGEEDIVNLDSKELQEYIDAIESAINANKGKDSFDTTDMEDIKKLSSIEVSIESSVKDINTYIEGNMDIDGWFGDEGKINIPDGSVAEKEAVKGIAEKFNDALNKALDKDKDFKSVITKEVNKITDDTQIQQQIQKIATKMENGAYDKEGWSEKIVSNMKEHNQDIKEAGEKVK